MEIKHWAPTLEGGRETPRSGEQDLDAHIRKATEALCLMQREDGHFVFELEADATIPAEYVLFTHYLGEEADSAREAKIASYLRRIQGSHGGWPLFHEGALDVSASVKAYFALKMIGDDPAASHMVRARKAILDRGGAEMSNVFTRFLLALYGVVGWHAVPAMPVEILLLPKWSPFHLSKVSYWARTVLAPLLVLGALRPRARNPRGIGIDELFQAPPLRIGTRAKAAHQSWPWFLGFTAIDKALRAAEPLFPAKPRARAIEAAVRFVKERLNGEDGLGAIFPAMANSVMMFDALGVGEADPARAVARKSIDKLLVETESETYCQPCVSPVWDTALTVHTLLEACDPGALERARKALDWLKPLQILDLKGDWAGARPGVRPGGWAFQYANPHYPDLDDTAVVVMAMDRANATTGDGPGTYRAAIARGREWVEGLQSKNGGWAAFDADNTHDFLNNIPFADHGALLDPPTVDVTARCVSMLAQLGEKPDSNAALKQGIAFILKHQEKDGSWYGRWGMNYIYGTWSVLCALNVIGPGAAGEAVRRAGSWLLGIQNEDGGWGEDGSSYKLDYRGYEKAPSTAAQTSWALLGLMAAGKADHPAVSRGIAYLIGKQRADGTWEDRRFNAPGFPRVFYLRYHGYAKYFPLWALARYRNLTEGNRAPVLFGM